MPCVEAHMRDMLEDGFEVCVVKDATAAAVLPEGEPSGSPPS